MFLRRVKMNRMQWIGSLWLLGIFLSAEVVRTLGHANFMTGNPEYRLFRYLFTNYSNAVRPVRHVADVVPVIFDIGFSQIVNLQEKNQILLSNLWVRLQWYDPWLKWNESEFGGIEVFRVEPRMVWKPDIVLYNNVDSDSSGEMYKFTTKVLLYSSGKVRWLSPIQVQSECKIDITNFPLDDQQCKLKFGSWAYDGHQLNLTLARGTADLSMYTANGEWEMLSGNAKRKISYFSCCKAPYITLIYTFHLRRRALFYFMNLILPCVLLTFLSALTFRFPPESGERVSLTITILLGMTVFMLIFIDNIPPTSEVVPLIGRYFSCSVFIMGASLIATCVSLSFYYNKPSTDMPLWIRILAFRCLGPALGIRPPKHIPIANEGKAPSRERANSNKGILFNESSDKRRKIHRQHSTLNRKLETSSMLSQSSSFPNHLDKQQPFMRVFLDSEAARCPPEPTRNQQFFCCCNAAGQSTEDSEIVEKREEWHYVAAVADRFFFYLFIVIICCCAVIVFLLSPAVDMIF